MQEIKLSGSMTILLHMRKLLGIVFEMDLSLHLPILRIFVWKLFIPFVTLDIEGTGPTFMIGNRNLKRTDKVLEQNAETGNIEMKRGTWALSQLWQWLDTNNQLINYILYTIRSKI